MRGGTAKYLGCAIVAAWLLWINFRYWSALLNSGVLPAATPQYYFRTNWSGLAILVGPSVLAGGLAAAGLRRRYGSAPLRWHLAVPLSCFLFIDIWILFAIRRFMDCFDLLECLSGSLWLFELHLVPVVGLGLWMGYVIISYGLRWRAR